ncbi:MAG: polysaccharide export protein [Alphaproteobacteria bacterium]|jgi:protein involved in polysaccharide export with SLBB domain|nr:polysaccharide export protein [Alphaproteobacteria bacterium]
MFSGKRAQMARAAVVAIIALAWSGCSFMDEAPKPRPVAMPVHSADLSSYEFAPGDQIRIDTLAHKDLSLDTAVADDGTIEMPLIGRIKVTGLTTSRLRDVVTQALDKDFIVDPKVNVEILKYRPFYVSGEVNSPGSFEYKAGMDVRKAVALAGGYTRRASHDAIEITRPVLGKKRTFPGRKDSRILPGDVIEIQRRWF